MFGVHPGTILKQALQMITPAEAKAGLPLAVIPYIDGFGDTNSSFSWPLRVCLCGARVAEAKTPAMPPFANNADANWSCFVLLATHPLVLAHGSAKSAAPA